MPISSGEILFCAALGVSWLNSALHVLWADRPMYAVSGPELTRPVQAGRAAILVVASVVFVATVWAWAASGWPRVGAVAALATMLALRQWETRQWEGDIVVRLGKYVPTAACLTGWVIAASITRWMGWEEAASVDAGWQAACGVLAAIYALAGASKVRLTGWGWGSWGHQALLIAERAYTGPMWVRRVRAWAGRSPRVCAVVGGFGLVSEGLCAFYVVPDLRAVLTGAVLSLHAGIVLLLGYVEPEWYLLMIALTVITGS